MKNRIFSLLSLAILFIAQGVVYAGGQEESERIYGFSKENTIKQKKFEARINTIVNPEQNRTILRHLSSRVNYAGSPGDRLNAEYYRDYLKNLGFKTKIYSYFVYLPYPERSQVFIKGDQPLTLVPGEVGVAQDPMSKKAKITPYNAYSPSGKVTGKVVYCNYARPEDFDFLEQQGIDIKGKIVMARYGSLFRGSKVYQAEIRGAAGIILYSDPIDDGYFVGDVYPKGPMRPADAIQRGSIYYMFTHPGDPLTPMKPALQFAPRIKPENAGLPAIPSIPLGYGQAAEILKRMKGGEVPRHWQGALPFKYHFGSQDLEVTIDVKNDYQIREIWDVIGILEGTQNPDQWVMVGCHRDAWVAGTADPHSGNSVILEAARAISEASRESGGLKRSIVVCSWDAEEFGVMGSIEWVEEMQDTLKDKAVLYMNADAIVSGANFGAAALPTARPAFQQVISEVKNPEGMNYFQAWKNQDKKERGGLRFYPFSSMGGGGSDHTGFIHHVGIPCISAGSWGRSGVHHSSYDTMYWMETFGDPHFLHHAAISRLMAVVLSRFANADVLPLAPSQYAVELQKFHQNLIESVPPRYKIHLEEMEMLYQEIAEKGGELESRIAKALGEGNLKPQQCLALDKALNSLERSFISPEGLPGRPWNMNLLYSPNIENGYGMVTFPGLMSTIDKEDKFIIEVERFKKCLNIYLEAINRARKVLN